MELPFDPFVLSLARHDARLLQMRRARLETHRLKHLTKAVHHRLRKAYYLKLRALDLPSVDVVGIEEKVLVLLRTHPDAQIAGLLARYQELRDRSRSALDEEAEAEEEYLRARAELGTPLLDDAPALWPLGQR